jgi:hypothetical protein
MRIRNPGFDPIKRRVVTWLGKDILTVQYRRRPSVNLYRKNRVVGSYLDKKKGICGFGSVFRIHILIEEGKNGQQKGTIKAVLLPYFMFNFVFEVIVLINPEFVSGFGPRIKP